MPDRTTAALTRRAFLRVIPAVGGVALLAACTPASTPSPTAAPAAPPPAAPAAAAQSPAAAPPPSPVAKPSPGVATPGTKSTSGSFTFGVLIPITGPAAQAGTSFRRGVEMAVGEINAQGGASGLAFDANFQDHKGTAQGGTEGMNQLVNIARVPYVIASFSSVSLAAQPMAVQNKVLLINAGGTDVSLLNKPWLYNNQVMAPQLIPPLANYAWDQGLKRAALIGSSDAYGDSTRKALNEVWQKLGGQMLADEAFPLNQTDFSAQLIKIKSVNPQVIMTVAIGQTLGTLVKQARALGIDAQFMSPLGDNSVIAAAGPAAEGMVDCGIAVDLQTQDPGALKFQQSYQQKFNEPPDWPAGTMYESVYLLRDLMNGAAQSGGDVHSGEALLNALERKPEFHNYLAGGTVKFAPDHSVSRKLAVRKVQNGAWVVFKLVDPS